MKTRVKKHNFIRSCGRWSDVLPLAVLISLALTYGGTLLSYIVLVIVSFSKYMGSVFKDAGSIITNASGASNNAGNEREFLIQYLVFAGIWIVVIAVVLIFKKDRPMLRCMGKREGGKTFLVTGMGFLLGFGLNGICILISVLTGDIHIYFNKFDPGLFFAFLFAVAIQSGAEELSIRWYLYQKLRRRYRHPAVAIVANSVIFSLMHILNPGITIVSLLQILAAGVLLSLMIHYYDGFWMAVAFHTAWNFTQNIIFGLPNSGIPSQFSLFSLDIATAKDGLFYNTVFGVEGSIGASIILIISCVIIIIINRKKKEKRDVWIAQESAAAVVS